MYLFFFSFMGIRESKYMKYFMLKFMYEIFSDYVSNNCKQNHSKISNSSTTKIEPKAKKLRDLENESFNSRFNYL